MNIQEFAQARPRGYDPLVCRSHHYKSFYLAGRAAFVRKVREACQELEVMACFEEAREALEPRQAVVNVGEEWATASTGITYQRDTYTEIISVKEAVRRLFADSRKEGQ